MRELTTRCDITPLGPTGPTGSTGGYDTGGDCHLRVWVSSAAEGEDPHIFVTEEMPREYPGGPSSYRFSHVACPTDMREYPAEAPSAGGHYFRLGGANLLFDSPAQAGEFMDTVRSHLALLERSEAMLAGDCTREEILDV